MRTRSGARLGDSGRNSPVFLPRTRSQARQARAQAQYLELTVFRKARKISRPAPGAAVKRRTARPTTSSAGADSGQQTTARPTSSKSTFKGKRPPKQKVTDCFPIRRSTRKNRGELRTEAQIRLNELIKSGKEEGMRVGLFDGKGRGVITTRPFHRGDYVVEYHGDLIDLAAAKKREARYAKDPNTGCYMYYFHYRSKGYCVDATKESGRLGRLINHSKSGNCQTKLHPIDGVPHLIVIATRDIEVGEELLYDYGDRSKASIAAHPWLKY